MGFLNKVKRFFSKPKTLTKRQKAQAYLSGIGGAHEGGKHNKRGLTDWIPFLHSANTETSDFEQETLVARSRDAYRNHELAKAAVGRANIGVVGDGLFANPSLDYKFLGLSDSQGDELEESIEREFGFACETCDAEGELNFYAKQQVTYLSTLLDGDIGVNIFFRKRIHDIYSIKLQEIDSARVINKNKQPDNDKLIKGVEIDSFGAPIAYHVLRAHPSDFNTHHEKTFQWDRIEVRSRMTGRKKFLFVKGKDRSSQLRGIPYLASILEPLKQFKRYNEAELVAAVLNSFLTFFLKDESDIEDMPLPVIEGDSRDPKKRNTIEISPGALVPLTATQSIEPFQPNRPNDQFDSFTQTIMRTLSAALNIPMEEVILKFDSSYSASRAAMLRAFSFYKNHRKMLERLYCQPFYSRWFDEAVALGRLPYIKNYADEARRLAYHRVDWIGSTMGAIDPTKEAQSAKLRIETGLSSIPMEAQQISGLSIRQIARQNQKARRILGFGPEEIRSQRNVSVLEEEPIDQQEEEFKDEQ